MFFISWQTLKSFDQFSNMILDETSERKMCVCNGQHYHANQPLGLYIVRGDSLVLMGEISDAIQTTSKEVTVEELEELACQQDDNEQELEWDFDNDLIA